MGKVQQRRRRKKRQRDWIVLLLDPTKQVPMNVLACSEEDPSQYTVHYWRLENVDAAYRFSKTEATKTAKIWNGRVWDAIAVHVDEAVVLYG